MLTMNVERWIVFAHGAGASSSSGWMRRWRERLATVAPTFTFDYPYMTEGRRLPDPLPRLVSAHQTAIARLHQSSPEMVGATPRPAVTVRRRQPRSSRAVAREAPPEPSPKPPRQLVLAGKSMGGRVGCHVALVQPSVSALICFGYPLVSSGKKAALRDEVLLALRTPVLFVQGSRDPLCPLERLAEVRGKMRAPNELFVVEGGDHSLELSAAARRERAISQDDADGAALAAIGAFLARALRPHGATVE